MASTTLLAPSVPPLARLAIFGSKLNLALFSFHLITFPFFPSLSLLSLSLPSPLLPLSPIPSYLPTPSLVLSSHLSSFPSSSLHTYLPFPHPPFSKKIFFFLFSSIFHPIDWLISKTKNSDYECRGGALTIIFPGIQDLADFSWNDRGSAYRCN